MPTVRYGIASDAAGRARRGHLLPGAQAEALGLLNTYLEKELA